jgi:hypothetical protein
VGRAFWLLGASQAPALTPNTKNCIPSTSQPPPIACPQEEASEKLRIVRTVLEQGGQFSGINRKVQLKPITWGPPEAPADRAASAGGGEAGGADKDSGSRDGSVKEGGAGKDGGGKESKDGGNSKDGGKAEAADGKEGSKDGGKEGGKDGSKEAGKEAGKEGKEAKGGKEGKEGKEGKQGGLVVKELLLILKWGGVLTHAGRKQAEDLGKSFRMLMYPR